MSILKRFIVFPILLLFVLQSFASIRIQYSLNESWQFAKGDQNAATWEKVSFPHTWNALDVMDDVPDYYRGVAWYKRSIIIPETFAQKQVSVYFEGANQELELFLNGKSVGKHAGGYTRFSFDITPFISVGSENDFTIKVDNSFNKNIPPLTADFTFFGGIYRDVWLIATAKQHISTNFYASSGVFITTPNVSAEKASVSIKTLINNASNSIRKVRVEQKVISPQKAVVMKTSKTIKLLANVQNLENIQTMEVKQPQLWSPDSPNLYAVYTQIYDDKTNELLDEVHQPLGFRWFSFTVDKGFEINGKALKLIGTNRHQCFDGLGNALPDEIHVRDIKLLKAMGGNFLRISHYPQDPTMLEMCDKLGIVCSVEIPIVNEITENEEFSANCLHMAREMVFQDYNRPSVVIWSYMNEVLLRQPFKGDSVRNSIYFKSVNALAKTIENQIRKDDPSRYTIIPFHGNYKDYDAAGLTRIPMLIGWNLYQGWYGGAFSGFATFLDDIHEKLPNTPLLITEYGADVDPRLHSFDPVRFDYTQEYANLYHEVYLKAIQERKFVVGATIWNLNDFHSETRENAVPHINNKGITTVTRELKDTYLQYQAALSKQPIVNISGQIWKIRGGVANEKGVCLQPIKVYSNLPKVEVLVNGKSIGEQNVVDNIANFEIPFFNGENTIEAVGLSSNGIKTKDFQKIDFRLIPKNLKDTDLKFSEINVMLGSKRYFEDKIMSKIWLPEKEYSVGSWGYVGGSVYGKKTRHGIQPASEMNVKGTTIDPVFQTMRVGLQAFKLDVPDGEYSVELYFAELQSKEAGKTLIYNLGNDAEKENFDERIFTVSINNILQIENLNLAQEFGEQQAVIKKFAVSAENGAGINIQFDAIKGEPILNALRVYRRY